MVFLFFFLENCGQINKIEPFNVQHTQYVNLCNQNSKKISTKKEKSSRLKLCLTTRV